VFVHANSRVALPATERHPLAIVVHASSKRWFIATACFLAAGALIYVYWFQRMPRYGHHGVPFHVVFLLVAFVSSGAAIVLRSIWFGLFAGLLLLYGTGAMLSWLPPA
jgi:hypothetical protein